LTFGLVVSKGVLRRRVFGINNFIGLIFTYFVEASPI